MADERAGSLCTGQANEEDGDAHDIRVLPPGGFDDEGVSRRACIDLIQAIF